MARLRLDQLGIDPNGADRLDRDLRDVFAVQDEIATQIASQVLAQLGRREVERLGAVSGERLDTWDLWLRARCGLSKGREAAAEAVRLLETAAARDPRVLATSIARATEAWRLGQHEDWRHHIAAGAAAPAQLGRRDQAQQRLSHILAVAPTATADSLTRNIRWEHQAHIQRLREGLVLAGLPTS